MARTPRDKQDPARQQPEPEGGPIERAREFLEERLTPLKRKSEGPPPEHNVDKVPEAGGEPPSEGEPRGLRREQPESEGERPARIDRRRLIQEYRKRQERKESAPRGGPDPAAAIAVAPAPPPANNWIPIGPSVLRQGQGGVMPATSGRTPAIAVLAGGNRVYIGAANGGVWRTEDGGANWRSLMDAFDLDPTHTAADSLAVGAVAVVPGASADQDRIYVGSGEGPGGAYFGVGPIISTNGGEDWATEPVSPGSPELAGSAFYALAVDPADTDRVVGATRRGLYRREPDGAGGFQWDRKAPPGSGFLWATSAVVARAGGVTTFYAAFGNGLVYSSTDGDGWAVAGTGFPAGVGRVSLAVQPDNPDVLYAFTELGSVFRLDVAEGNWRQVTGIPPANQLVTSQGWYDLAIAVAPDDVNRIYLGGSTVSSGGDWSGALYRCDLTVTAAAVTSANTFIGNSVHADIHAIVFTPDNPSQMWVGCDGGVFRADNAGGTGNIFVSLNKDLQTMTMNYLGQHPTEDAVVFCGTQDNGGERFTGEETWLYSSGGDSGFFVVNWSDPYKIADTYVRGAVRRSTTGGTRYSYTNVPVPLAAEGVLFYAPLVGTPRNAGAPAEAEILAFGSVRPWISTNFGTSWQSIPNNTLAGDQLNNPIKSLAFASADKLYAGTMGGRVYRFVNTGASWTRTQLDTMGGANALPLAGVVTDIAVDLADASGDSIYIAFGGSGDYRHVWHFDGAQWEQRSGPAAGSADALLDVQHNALAVDPANPAHLYVGADIGIWRSLDAGASWEVFADGLPDAAVLDLMLHHPRRILRASTHGRGVFERTLDNRPKQGVELYVRDTQLDQGRFTTINGGPDPTQQGQSVVHWRGPDIKLDTPDVNGNYQFPLSGTINYLDFVDRLNDDSKNVATHATETITTRVYVQVHNRGVVPADNVRVICLLANASAGLPPLPAGYHVNVQNGTPINNADWQTIGIAALDDVRVGFPRVAAFDLTSDKLPPPANLAGNDHHCVLALVTHADDPYTATITNTDQSSRQERKAAHKNLKVVQFTGTLPTPPPLVVPFRLHAGLREGAPCDLVVALGDYRGRARLFLPKMRTDGDLQQLAVGLRAGEDFDEFRRWSKGQEELIEKNRSGRHPYNAIWSKQRLADIAAALDHGVMFHARGRREVGLRRLLLPPAGHHTLFLMLDRPPNGRTGERFDIQITQRDSEKRELVGGLDLRVELQPEPEKRPRIHVGRRKKGLATAVPA